MPSRPFDVPRRTLLKAGLLSPLAAAVGIPSTGAEASRAEGPVPLREKFFGCIAGCHIGSSMGAPVEGWPHERIEKEHGTLDRLLPYEHYGNGWRREPGTTEDGVERQKLMIAAIMEKKDRVTAEDVKAAWVKHIKPESAGKVSEPFEATLLALAKAGIPAVDIGRYCDYAGLVSMARSCHPLGLINAGDVPGAIADVHEVGQLYQTACSRGIRWASVTAAAIASATKPGATVESVLDDLHLGEVDSGLKLTEGCKDFRDLRRAFDKVYSGAGVPYAFSYANEVVTKALCIFRMTRGNLRDTIVAGVNMGRDTDCVTAVSSGIAGALCGGGSLPPEWIDAVDRATKQNPYTNSQRNLREHSDGLHRAFQARIERMKTYAEEMGRA
jgi:ADP-ribosylglycohydrolase